MTKREAAELLLERMNRVNGVNNAFFGAMDGTVGNINVLQRDMNRAVEALRAGDTSKLREMAATLHVQGSLTGTEYEQIMETLA